MVRCALLAVAAGLVTSAAHAEPTFEGQTITIVTSTGPGGSYDVTARLVARYISRYIPGRPTMIVQNMPGGGNVLATNHMYNRAPRDGTTIASLHSAMPLHQVLDTRGVLFDTGKFNWLGSMGAENEAILTWHTAGVTSIKDAMEREIILGGTGPGSGIVIIPTAMNNVLGTKFKIVTGYRSSEEINVAMLRGEVQGRAFGFGSIVSQHPDWIKEKKVTFLAQAGAEREPDLRDVPLLTELARTEEQRHILELISSPTVLGKAFLAPPGVAADRLAVLRKAFAAMLRDSAFVSEAQKLQIEIHPMSAEQVARVVADTINAPPDLVAKARAAMAAPAP